MFLASPLLFAELLLSMALVHHGSIPREAPRKTWQKNPEETHRIMEDRTLLKCLRGLDTPTMYGGYTLWKVKSATEV